MYVVLLHGFLFVVHSYGKKIKAQILARLGVNIIDDEEAQLNM